MNRNMVKYFILAMPGMVNFVIGGLCFIFAYKLSKMECDGWMLTIPAVLWGITYTATNFLLRKTVNRDNAPELIMLAGISLAAAPVFLLLPGYRALIMSQILSALGGALYTPASQLMAKRIDPGSGGDIMKVSAGYTFIVSLGLGVANFLCGQLSFATCIGACIALPAILAAAIVPCAKLFPAQDDESITKSDSPVSDRDEKMPDLIIAGWVTAGVLAISLSMLRTCEPFHGVNIGFSKAVCGNALAIEGVAGGLTALALVRSRRWMFRAAPAAGMLFLMFAALALFGLARMPWMFYVGGAFFGMAYGCMVSYLIFHAMVNKEKDGFYSSINESIIGVMAIVGPSLNALAGRNTSYIPFAICAIVAVCASAFVGLYVSHKLRTPRSPWSDLRRR